MLELARRIIRESKHIVFPDKSKTRLAREVVRLSRKPGENVRRAQENSSGPV